MKPKLFFVPLRIGFAASGAESTSWMGKLIVVSFVRVVGRPIPP